jgi:hypothetical protein
MEDRTMAGLDKALYNFARRGVLPTLGGTMASGPAMIGNGGALIPSRPGKTYFVAGNYGSDSADGKSWDTALKTLDAAFDISNAFIAAGSTGWAARNTICISGDSFNEDLLVFPSKADVIGYGSCDGFAMASIEGNHAPVNAQNWATRFFNIRFVTEAAGVIITLANTSGGVQLIECLVDATGDATATLGFSLTASTYFKLINTRFQGAFSTGYGYFATGEALGFEAIGCRMTGSAGYGITLHSGTTMSYLGLMQENIIQAAGCTLDDQQNQIILVGNRFISAAANGDASLHLHASVRAADNWLSNASTSGPYPVLDTTP